MWKNAHTRGVTRRRVAGAVLAAALLLSAPGCARSPDPAGGGSSPQAWQTIVDRWRSRAAAPAVVVGVQDGELATWVGASGTSERDGHNAVDPSATFRIASITKVFVAVVALQLVEEGRLDLDEPLSAYRPALPYGQVTIRQLLNHTSGIPDYSQTPNLGEELLADRDRRWSSTEVIALIENNKPQFPAGTGYQYSNTDYVLLGEVISAVTGTSWAQQVRDRILDPLHLDSHLHPRHGTGSGPPAPRLLRHRQRRRRRKRRDRRNLAGAGNLRRPRRGHGVQREGPPHLRRRPVPRPAPPPVERFQAMVAEGQFHPRNSNYGLGLEIVRPDYQTTDLGPRRIPSRLQVGAVVRAVPRRRHRRPHQHIPRQPARPRRTDHAHPARTDPPAMNQPSPAPHTLPISLLLHLTPGLLTAASYLALIPVARAWGLPSGGRPGRLSTPGHRTAPARHPHPGPTAEPARDTGHRPASGSPDARGPRMGCGDRRPGGRRVRRRPTRQWVG